MAFVVHVQCRTMRVLRTFLASIAFGVALAGSGSSIAQTYPSRPITIVVPFAAGGGNDVVARILAEGMRKSLGQPVIVENVTGAAGNVGVARVSRASPDGYTIISGGWGTFVANGAIYSLSYDVRKDFEPVALQPAEPLVMLSRKTLPATNLRELIDWLKANPGKASMGTTGVGTPEHIFGYYLQRETGTQFQFVPYRGAPQEMQDMLAGSIDMMFPVAAAALSALHTGDVKVYAVSTPDHLATAPEIPTIEEAGFPNLAFKNWRAFFVPRGTPKDIVDKLNAAVVDTLADTAVQARLSDLGQQFWPREQETPEALGAFQKAEIDKWWPIIRAAGIKPE
jgi:tripartite-type tricarboxylate transporter receptor subunit TctC